MADLLDRCACGAIRMAPYPDWDERNSRRKKPKPAKAKGKGDWAVVQDLRPFGYRVASRHTSRRDADRAARASQYLAVMETSAVEAENARLKYQAEFDREFAAYQARRGQA